MSWIRDGGLFQYDRMIARLLVAGESGPFTLAVTSSVLGEGVSTVCAALGCALAESTGKRILLIDANLRSQVQHELFDVPLTPGLHDYITDSEQRRDVADESYTFRRTVSQTVVDNL